MFLPFTNKLKYKIEIGKISDLLKANIKVIKRAKIKDCRYFSNKENDFTETTAIEKQKNAETFIFLNPQTQDCVIKMFLTEHRKFTYKILHYF